MFVYAPWCRLQGLLRLASMLVRAAPMTPVMYDQAMSPFHGHSADKKDSAKKSSEQDMEAAAPPAAEATKSEP